MTQTARELVRNMLSGGPMERIPVVDYPWKDTLTTWVEQGYPVEQVDGREPEPMSPTDRFGFDLVGLGGKFDMLPIPDYEEIVEETAEWYVKRNGAGAALKYWKHKSGTPEHIDFLMTSREVWARDYRPHLLEPDPSRIKLEQAQTNMTKRRGQQLWTYFGDLFIWENMRQSMGDICMYESLILDPEWIHDYNRVYTNFYKEQYKLLFELAGLPDGIWLYEDLGYKNGLFCSPRTLETLIFPYYAEVIDFFHSYGLPVVLHSCGDFTAALPLIVEVGFDAINPMEVKAGCDIMAFADRYADKLAFIGGFDARILEAGDRKQIRREIIAFIEGMKARDARFVFASDHSISPLVTYDTFRYALDVYREHMWY